MIREILFHVLYSGGVDMNSDHDTDEMEDEEEEEPTARPLPIPGLGSKQPSLRKQPTTIISQGKCHEILYQLFSMIVTIVSHGDL